MSHLLIQNQQFEQVLMAHQPDENAPAIRVC